MRRVMPMGDRREDGAIIPILAVFSVVMVAMAALVIDVGALQDERRQLQNGADAAALGLAQYIAATCSKGGCTQSTLDAQARALASANALDNASAVKVDPPDYTKQRVTVTTSTLAKDGGTILPYQFGQAVTGARGQTVTAKAVATWVGLSRAKVIPLTLSKCEFDKVTAGNTVFDVPTVIYFHGDKDAGSCKTGPAGKDLPGGFGWLKDNNDANSNDCNITPLASTATSTYTVQDDSGLPGTPHACDMSTLVNQDVLVTLYSGLTGTGSNGIYTIYGFGMFHITGYRFPSESAPKSAPPCKSGQSCIGGYFIKFVGTGDYGGPNVGNRVALVS